MLNDSPPALPPTPEQKKDPPPAATNPEKTDEEVQMGRTILSEDVGKGTGVSLSWVPSTSGSSNLILELPKEAKGNKKIAPRSVLHQWSRGEVKEMPDDCSAHPYQFKSNNALVALHSPDGFVVKTVKDAVKETNACQLYKHAKFTQKGVAPSNIVVTKKTGFFPEDIFREEFFAIRDAVAGDPNSLVQLVWTLKLDEKASRLVPEGLALITTKQIIVKTDIGVGLLHD